MSFEGVYKTNLYATHIERNGRFFLTDTQLMWECVVMADRWMWVSALLWLRRRTPLRALSELRHELGVSSLSMHVSVCWRAKSILHLRRTRPLERGVG